MGSNKIPKMKPRKQWIVRVARSVVIKYLTGKDVEDKELWWSTISFGYIVEKSLINNNNNIIIIITAIIIIIN